MKKIVLLTWWTWSEKEIANKSAEFFKKNIWVDFDSYILPEQFDNFYKNKEKYSLAIPIFHWEYGEDGKIFAYLDMIWIPHIFSKYDVHALCLDKFFTNQLLWSIWISIPKQYIYSWKVQDIWYPCIVKPNHGWSSFYTYKANSQEELLHAIHQIQIHTTDQVLIQEFIVWQEVSVPVMQWEILPIMSLEKQDNSMLFDYTSKYESENTMKEVFWKLPQNITKILEEKSLQIYNFLRIQDISRIDFIIQDNIPYFLEINTIPGMTQASILPKAWRLTWRNDTELIQSLISQHLWK